MCGNRKSESLLLTNCLRVLSSHSPPNSSNLTLYLERSTTTNLQQSSLSTSIAMKRSVTDRSWRLPLQLRRQAMHRRTYSDSSEASHCSRASSSSEDQFAFSPATEHPPTRSVTSNFTASLDQTAGTYTLARVVLH